MTRKREPDFGISGQKQINGIVYDGFIIHDPFSVQIFIKVVTNIIYSVVDEYRPVDLILYYPSEDYIYYLENYTMFHLVKEIKLNEHYEQDNRERILVYRLQY